MKLYLTHHVGCLFAFCNASCNLTNARSSPSRISIAALNLEARDLTLEIVGKHCWARLLRSFFLLPPLPIGWRSYWRAGRENNASRKLKRAVTVICLAAKRSFFFGGTHC